MHQPMHPIEIGIMKENCEKDAKEKVQISILIYIIVSYMEYLLF